MSEVFPITTPPPILTTAMQISTTIGISTFIGLSTAGLLINFPDPIISSLSTITVGDLSGISTSVVINQSIISLTDLINSHAAIEYKENIDKQSLTSFINPVSESLMPKLFEWAKNGFPTTLLLQKIDIDVPQVCSDGVIRDMPQYFEYLIGMTLLELDSYFATKFEGFIVHHSYNNNSLTLYLQKP